MLRNKLGPVFNIVNFVFVVVFVYFVKKILLSAGRTRVSKTKNKEHLDQLLFQEGQTLDQL